MRPKMAHSLAPSSLAASIRSRGIPAANWRIRKMPKALTIPGKIRAQSEFSTPSRLAMM